MILLYYIVTVVLNMKKVVLHFFDEESAIAFKENWLSFSNNKEYSSIEQKGNICILYYACSSDKICSSAPNSIFRGCQHCG